MLRNIAKLYNSKGKSIIWQKRACRFLRDFCFNIVTNSPVNPKKIFLEEQIGTQVKILLQSLKQNLTIPENVIL
jgi:hypothetical protein